MAIDCIRGGSLGESARDDETIVGVYRTLGFFRRLPVRSLASERRRSSQ
jgi:hypothetical protein